MAGFGKFAEGDYAVDDIGDGRSGDYGDGYAKSNGNKIGEGQVKADICGDF